MLALILVSLSAALGAALPSNITFTALAAGASAFASNSAGNLRLSSIAAPIQGAGSPGSESTWQLNIDDTSSGYKQAITGFGAAVTDATVTSFNTLSSTKLNSLLNELLTSAGADFSLMRHTIGASDLSEDPAYTYDDNTGGVDPNLTGFNLGDRGSAMAKMLTQMKSLQCSLKVFGSPWSAPGWMKLNSVIDGTTTNNNLNDGYLTNNGAQYSSAFAGYFVKYIQAYEAQGAHIDAITIQNEPLNSQAGYPTMYMFSDEQANLIQNYVGPALKNAGLDTKLWAYDHNTGMETPGGFS
jgi:glucosylceramidase